MRCVSQQALVKGELGELTVNQVRSIDEHVAVCTGCARAREQLRQLTADLSRVPQPIHGAEFVARVMAARSHESAATARAGRRFRLSMLAAAAALVLVAAGSVKLLANRPGAKESWTARGQESKTKVPVNAPASEVLVMREGKLLPLSGQTLSSADAFAVRYLNPTGRTQYLAAFAVDAAGAVHWIFPAYLDAAMDPLSIPLAPATDERLLPQVVAPEKPASGPMRVLTLISPEPTSVKRIETALRDAPAGASAGRALAALDPSARIREWRCAWSAR
jgi:hypothetical protein